METTDIEIVGSAGTKYRAGKRIGGDEHYSLYQCSTEDKGATLILKIAKFKKNNGDLDREAFLLTDLFKEAQATQEEFAKKKENDGKFLNYHFFFPILVETFISDTQDDRRVLILDFSHICKSLGELAPLSLIMEKDQVRVDPRTSAWILGKLLKAIDFAHNQNISIEDLSVDNILINREQHYVSIFDWSRAKISSISLSKEEISKELAQATQSVVEFLGGNETDWSIPEDVQLKDGLYEKMLQQLCNGEITDAGRAHKNFYSLIRSLWPRGFHPYTTYSL